MAPSDCPPGALSRLRRLWRALPLPMAVRRRVSPLIGRAFAAAAPRLVPRPAPLRSIAKGDLVVSAFFTGTHGIAQAGRLTAAGLERAGLRVRRHDLDEDPTGHTLDAGAAADGGVWICHANAPEALVYLARSGGRPWKGRYRIGYWAYELPRLPQDWVPALAFFHEIWVPSAFVAEAVRAAAPRTAAKLRVVPHPLPDLATVAPDRAAFAPTPAFTFLAMADLRSSAARKNPMGAVEAFKAAFRPDDAGVALLLKVGGESAEPDALEALTAAIAGWPSIRILTGHLDAARILTLIASVDAFVSLHRAEGFGLVIAEAMAVGTPVIATGWSGPMDFAEGASLMVPATLVPARDPGGRYDLPGQHWAEPDPAAAAAAMAQLAGDPAQARALGLRGRAAAVKRLGGPMATQDLRPFLTDAVFRTDGGAS